MKNLYNKLKSTNNFFLIAGPCVLEDIDKMLLIASTLKKLTEERNIPFVFKASFLKANRTSITSEIGPGLKAGLDILRCIKNECEVPIITDVHECIEIDAVSEVVDIIQIPAFLSRQTNLLLTAARTGKIVNIKKGQFLSPDDMCHQIEKITSVNNHQILQTERGSTFGYHNLVVDFRGFAIMRSNGYPVIYDVTHSLQRPSLGKVSGGNPEYVPMMCRAALATGCVDGLFIETHQNPSLALSDAHCQYKLDLMPSLLDECVNICNITKSVSP